MDVRFGQLLPSEVAHLQLLDDLAARWGLNDAQLADALGVNTACIGRWRCHGVANRCVPALNALIADARDGLDVGRGITHDLGKHVG